jgi:ABC-2 type transport system permease protein
MNPITAIIERNLINYVRNKGRMIGSLVMSMFMLVIFSFLMKSSMSSFDQPMNYLIAGVIIMSVFQTSINNSTDVLSDIANGYMKEVLVAPITRSQISIGNILSSAIVSVLQGTILIFMGLFVGLRLVILQIILMLAVMFIASVTFSAIGLFLATISRNSTSFQTISSMIIMPLTFVSGAYIPTTMMPGFLKPIVYINPLTYVTSIFRFISLNTSNMGIDELISEGIAFNIRGIIITPIGGLFIMMIIGAFFFSICVYKFSQADFSTVKVARGMQGGMPKN